MMPNPSLSGKLAQAQNAHLLREAEQLRLVAQLSEPGPNLHILPARLVSFSALAKLRDALCKRL